MKEISSIENRNERIKSFHCLAYTVNEGSNIPSEIKPRVAAAERHYYSLNTVM